MTDKKALAKSDGPNGAGNAGTGKPQQVGQQPAQSQASAAAQPRQHTTPGRKPLFRT